MLFPAFLELFLCHGKALPWWLWYIWLWSTASPLPVGWNLGLIGDDLQACRELNFLCNSLADIYVSLELFHGGVGLLLKKPNCVECFSRGDKHFTLSHWQILKSYPLPVCIYLGLLLFWLPALDYIIRFDNILLPFELITFDILYHLFPFRNTIYDKFPRRLDIFQSKEVNAHPYLIVVEIWSEQVPINVCLVLEELRSTTARLN